ncbi:MAG: hypothetical protein HY810_05635 [Candidatus Omnitrophica bacterium]|nr:hypothetical protein [Candidatus Omnitrophota bacterium]
MKYSRVKIFLHLSILTIALILRPNLSLLYAQKQEQVTSWVLSEKILGGGFWKADCSLNKLTFKVKEEISLNVRLTVKSKEFNKYRDLLEKIELNLITERIFDKDGRPHLIVNNFMSSGLTPTGMPIEFFALPWLEGDGKMLSRYNSILDIQSVRMKKEMAFNKNSVQVEFSLVKEIPDNLPDGYYRFFLDFSPVFKKDGSQFKGRLSLIAPLRLDPYNYSHISFHGQLPLSQKTYASPIFIIGNPVTPKMIWSLFLNKVEMGVHGILAEEDKPYFRLSPRHNVPDKFIIPPGKTLNIEPDFPTLFADKAGISFVEKILPFCVPIALNYKSGEFSVKIQMPNGKQKDFGVSKINKKTKFGAGTTQKCYNFKFDQYGHYTIILKGWIEDIWGNKYNGGGTYHLWVARRLTFATSVKPGSPFEVGDSYPTSVFVHPSFPAQVSIEVEEYINSDEHNVKKWQVEGDASRFGYFYSKEKINFIEPGEYLAKINAVYKDSTGVIWMGDQAGSSVIAPSDIQMIVHGRKFTRPFYPNNEPEARFNLHTEGGFSKNKIFSSEEIDYNNCVNLTLPYYSGDIMFIASTPEGANAIDARLSIEDDKNESIRTTTENEIHPYNFPESMLTQAYFYFSAIRPGIITRTFTADLECKFRDSYWPTSPAFNAFGNQFNVGKYGDLPQDIYRFMGGCVFRDLKNNKSCYGIYAAMAIIIPKGSNANRVVAPFSEPLLEVNGREFYIFEAGAPSPGVIYEAGEPIGIGGMVFPPVSGINCSKEIIFPNGKNVISSGMSNKIGVLKMSPDVAITDEPGVYKIKEKCWYQDRIGDVIGTADGTYNIYVDDNIKEKFFSFKRPKYFEFDPKKGLNLNAVISGKINNPQVSYTAVMPGAILDEGKLAVIKNEFIYKFSPKEVNVQFPNYDFYDFEHISDDSFVRSLLVKEFCPSKSKIVDTVIVNFFLEGTDKNTGKKIYDVSTLTLRGNKAYITEYE